MSWRRNQWDRQPTLSGKHNFSNTKASFAVGEVAQVLSTMDASIGTITGILPQSAVPSLDQGAEGFTDELLQIRAHSISLRQKSDDPDTSFDVEITPNGGRLRNFVTENNTDPTRPVQNTALFGNDMSNSRAILSTCPPDASSVSFINSVLVDVCGNTVVGDELSRTYYSSNGTTALGNYKFNVRGASYFSNTDNWSTNTTSDPSSANASQPYAIYCDGNLRVNGTLAANTILENQTIQTTSNIELGGSAWVIGSTYDSNYQCGVTPANDTSNAINNSFDANELYCDNSGGSGQLWVLNNSYFLSNVDVCGNLVAGVGISSESNIGYTDSRLLVQQELTDTTDASAALLIQTAQSKKAAFGIQSMTDNSAWYMGSDPSYGWISTSKDITDQSNAAILVWKNNDSDGSKNCVGVNPGSASVNKPLVVGSNANGESASFGGILEIVDGSGSTWQSNTYGQPAITVINPSADASSNVNSTIGFQEAQTDNSFNGAISHVKHDASGNKQSIVLSSSGSAGNNYKDIAFFMNKDGSNCMSLAGDPSSSYYNAWFPQGIIGQGDQPSTTDTDSLSARRIMTLTNNLPDGSGVAVFVGGKDDVAQKSAEVWYGTTQEPSSLQYCPSARLNLFGNSNNVSVFGDLAKNSVGVGFRTSPDQAGATSIFQHPGSLVANAVDACGNVPALRAIRNGATLDDASYGELFTMEQLGPDSNGGNRKIGWMNNVSLSDNNGTTTSYQIASTDTVPLVDITTNNSSSPVFTVNQSVGVSNGVGSMSQPISGGFYNQWLGRFVDTSLNPAGLVVDASGRVALGVTSQWSESSTVIDTSLCGINSVSLSDYSGYNVVVGSGTATGNPTSVSNQNAYPTQDNGQVRPLMAVGGYHTGRYALVSDPSYTVADISFVSNSITNHYNEYQVWVQDVSNANVQTGINVLDTSGAILTVDTSDGYTKPPTNGTIPLQVYGGSQSGMVLGSYYSQSGASITYDATNKTISTGILANDASGIPVATNPMVLDSAGMVTLAGGLSASGSINTTGGIQSTTTVSGDKMYVTGDISANEPYQVVNVNYLRAYVDETIDSNPATTNYWVVASNYVQLADSVDTSNVSIQGTMSAHTFSATSDLRAKTEVKDIESATETVGQLRGVSYKMKDDISERLRYGLIAQEVEEVLPSLVHEVEEGHKSVNYIDMIGILVESVKELSARVKELESKPN